MMISKRGRYALIVMVDLARHNGGEPVNIRTIADRNNLSEKYIEQIMVTLNKFGMVYSVRGKSGGYKLKKQPSEYTVGDILRALEGALEPISGLAYELDKSSGAGEDIEYIMMWKGLYDTINRYVDGITLESLAENDRNFKV
ncbi:MAG: Rrf2 family transcriptional regulator [Oscillospiraceae bacterium]|nr:Rrf2 family transcriptional regulator [Oscillospiraceae bacterium]